MKKFIKLFWVFVIGCLLGYIMEVVFNFVRTGEFETRQGLIFGPFAPVYGIGTLAFYLILPKMRNSLQVLLYCMGDFRGCFYKDCISVF